MNNKKFPFKNVNTILPKSSYAAHAKKHRKIEEIKRFCGNQQTKPKNQMKRAKKTINNSLLE